MFNNSCQLKKSYDKKYQSSDKSCQFNQNFNIDSEMDNKNTLIKHENFKDLFNTKYEVKNNKKQYNENNMVNKNYENNNKFKNNIFLNSQKKYTNKNKLISFFEKDEKFVKNDAMCDNSVIYSLSNETEQSDTDINKTYTNT